jgi:hypothetical protein
MVVVNPVFVAEVEAPPKQSRDRTPRIDAALLIEPLALGAGRNEGHDHEVFPSGLARRAVISSRRTLAA